MIRNFTALCLALVALLCTPAFAQDIAKPVAAAESAAPAPADAARPGMVTTVPTRESLVAFFEQQMKNDPQVKDFTKRADGDYDFQTGFFPYTGRLKLLNAAVTADSDQYYDNLYRGIIEVELADADESFFKKYARSYATWTQGLNYYYNAKRGVWFAPSDWDAHAADFDKYAASKSEAVSTGACKTAPLWNQVKPYLPLGVAILFVLFLLLVARRANKRVWANHAKALEEQQRGLKMVEESLGHQREHTKLLQEILAAVRK